MTEVDRITDGQGNVVIVGSDGERVTLRGEPGRWRVIRDEQ